MTTRIRRGRRTIICDWCGRQTKTRRPLQTPELCLPCRAKGQNQALPDHEWAPKRKPGPKPVIRSKRELDKRLEESNV